jgi:hypothetical protein
LGHVLARRSPDSSVLCFRGCGIDLEAESFLGSSVYRLCLHVYMAQSFTNRMVLDLGREIVR